MRRRGACRHDRLARAVHRVAQLGEAHAVDIRVHPVMDPDLVSFGDLSCDQLRVGLHRGAQHEEGGPHAQPRQHVEHPWSPTGIRPVVEGQRQLSGLPVGLEDHSRTERAAGARRARGGSGRGGEVGVPPVSGSCAAARAEHARRRRQGGSSQEASPALTRSGT